MRFSGLMRITVLALGIAVLPFAAGCGGNPFNPPPDDDDPGLENVPLNDSPQNLMTRFEATYERQVLDQYELLLTSDFRFTFSNQSDANLVIQYGNNWGKDDETESTSHLFDGFTNDEGTFVPGAADIELTLTSVSFIDDPFKPDSGAYYKYVVVANTSLLLAVPGTDGFQISAPHDFYLVRGDVALLDSNQSATADRWYIRKWDDKSPALSAVAPRLASLGSSPLSGQPTKVTWGNLKGHYADGR